MLATEKRSEEQEQVLEQLQLEVKQQTTNADRKLRDAQTQLQSQAGSLCLLCAMWLACSVWAAMGPFGRLHNGQTLWQPRGCSRWALPESAGCSDPAPIFR